MTESHSNKVSWNTAQALIFEIGNLRSKANNYYINKDIPMALRCLSAIKMCVIHSLDESEIKELDKLEEELNRVNHMKDSYVKGFQRQKAYYESLIRLDNLYIKFNNLLQRTLEKYGYLIEKKEDKTKLIA